MYDGIKIQIIRIAKEADSGTPLKTMIQCGQNVAYLKNHKVFQTDCIALQGNDDIVYI